MKHKTILRSTLCVGLAILLTFCMLTLSCVAVETSASAETPSAYDTLTAYIRSQVADGKLLLMDGSGKTPVYAFVIDENIDGKTQTVTCITTLADKTANPNSRIDIYLAERADHTLKVRYREKTDGASNWDREATLSISPETYTGNETLQFTSTGSLPADVQADRSERATGFAKTAITALHEYSSTHLNLTAADFGFDALRVTTPNRPADTTAEATDDTAPAGNDLAETVNTLKTVLIVACIVLALGMLIIYSSLRRVLRRMDEAAETTAVPAPAPKPVAPPAPVGDDPAVIAAITAAIAATIAADEALSEEFAAGFRVVSFKKTSGITAWNR